MASIENIHGALCASWFECIQCLSLRKTLIILSISSQFYYLTAVYLSLMKQIHGNYRPLPLPRQNDQQVQLCEAFTLYFVCVQGWTE